MLRAVSSFITRVVGPKMLIGVLGSLSVALAVAGWQWRVAHEDAVTANERLDALRSDLSRAEQIINEQRAELAAFDAAVEAQRERERQARERAAEAEQRLRALEQSDEAVKAWSDDRVPRDVRRWLHNGTNPD